MNSFTTMRKNLFICLGSSQHYIARIPKDGWSASTRVWKSGSELSGILGVNRHGKYPCFLSPGDVDVGFQENIKIEKSLDVVKQFHITLKFLVKICHH